MSYYKPGTHINLKQKDSLFVRFSNAIWPYAVGTLAAYGFMDILLRANGL